MIENRVVGMENVSLEFITSLLIAQDDVTSPTLTYFSYSPDSVDVTTGSADIEVTLSCYDDMSGLSEASVTFKSPSGEQSEYPHFSFQGTMQDTLTTSMTIDQYSESGLWEVDRIEIGDEVGNWHTYLTDELDSMVFQTTLFVNQSGCTADDGTQCVE